MQVIHGMLDGAGTWGRVTLRKICAIIDQRPRQRLNLLRDMRMRGITVLMIEQNAKRALENSDDGIVLELGRTRIADRADKILADPRIGQLFLGGGLAAAAT